MSDLHFEVMLKDKAESAHNGFVEIEKIAKKTDAHQLIRNLLLSRKAKAEAIPDASAPAAERQAGGHTHGGGDALRVAGPFEVHSVAPVESSGLFTRLEVAETLVSSDLEGELQPGLSPDWTESSDGRTWTFDLPDGATFHDGTPVTAEATAASLEAAYAESASPLAAAPVERIAADGDAVRIDLTEPYPSLPAVLTHYSTAVLAPASWEGERVTEVIGTGPYAVAGIELPARVEVERFDDFRGEAPEVERISFQAVARAESRALMAISDQADVVFGLEPAGRERVDASDEARMVSSLQPRSLMMKVNVEDPVLEDVRVRQALSLALDRASMADAVLREPELAATQLFPPSLTAWNQPDLEPLEHDTDAAGDPARRGGLDRRPRRRTHPRRRAAAAHADDLPRPSRASPRWPPRSRRRSSRWACR